MRNYIEEIMAELYQSRGYLVLRNFWIPIKTKSGRLSGTDIDVLARNQKELLIIQVKTTINKREMVGSILTYFERIETFLQNGIAIDGSSDIGWWSKGVNVKKLVVYEDEKKSKGYVPQLEDEGIIVKPFSKYYNELVDYIDKKKSIREESPLLRMLHFIRKIKKK